MNDQPNDDKKTTGELREKQGHKKLWRILIPTLILIIAAGIYLLKNPIGKPRQHQLIRPKGHMLQQNLTWMQRPTLTWIRFCHMGCQLLSILVLIPVSLARKWRRSSSI
jgi:hypothetical protein